MELWLVLHGDSGPQREVAVVAEPSQTVQELTTALAVGTSRLFLQRTGLPLGGELSLSEAGLRSGDILLSAPPPVAERGARPTWQLVVAGGPDAGRATALPAGVTTVGRGGQAGIRLADQAMSRLHLQLAVTDETVIVSDSGSSNGTFLGGDRLAEPRLLEPGVLIEAGDTLLRITRDIADSAPTTLRDGRVQFSRPPRVSSPPADGQIRLPAPPDPLAKRRIPLASAFVPLLGAIAVAFATHNKSYLVYAVLGPVMLAASFFEDRRSGRKDLSARTTAFRAAVTSAETTLAGLLAQESVQRWAAHPDPGELLRRATRLSARLWERRTGDSDFLLLRLGWTDQPSTTGWSIADGGGAELRAEAIERLNAWGIARNVPVTVDMKASPVVGLVGSVVRVDELARWLVVQTAALHSPRDVCIAVAVSADRRESWDWAAWLPHSLPTGAPFAEHPFAADDEAARALIASLNDLVAARVEEAKGRLRQDAAAFSIVLLVLDERLVVPRAAIASLLETGPAVGIRVIWLGERDASLPGETGTIVSWADSGLTVTDVATGAAWADSQPDRVRGGDAITIARALAGIRDATARGRGAGDLPGTVSLPELLGAGQPSVDLVLSKWATRTASLAAPIGVGEAGLFAIDMRHDGPHGLLGGTTGAGKSEMLQTFVASLAAHHPPTRLTFLLVDYKGGAAFKDCVNLPHVVGYVTDLDGHLVHRALVSLNAELHRRERLLASVGAKDLIEMERKAPEQAPPGLLLLVDEFATLAKELPEFVEGVVNVAQRGRSLGIHMLLATQRPAGAINENIRANTNLRMALRMNDDADSMDVLGSRRAAALPRTLPGRAFVRTGASELTEVQIGYSGGHSLAGEASAPIQVFPLSAGRVQRPASEKPVEPAEHDSRPTDLQGLVALIVEASAKLGHAPPQRPWLPPLASLLPLAELPVADATGVNVGLVDLPTRQAQAPYPVNLAELGSLLVFGTSGAGKTTFLRTLAAALAQNHSPQDLHLYALDFASRGLGALESLPHCGAVVAGDDTERVQRLLGMIERWVIERKAAFGAAGCSTLEEYDRVRGGSAPMARVVVLLDSFGGFTSIFEKIDYGARIDAFPQLISEGRPLGIHFVVTADRRNAVPLAVFSTVQSRIVLRAADPDDYAMLGVDARAAKGAQLPPGRGFTGDGLELQVALVGTSPAGDAQSKALTSLGAALGAQWGSGSAAAVGAMPTEVGLAAVQDASMPLRPALGVGERELSAVTVDLTEGHFLVAGPNRSGKSTALATLGLGLRRADPGLEIHLLAGRRRTTLTAHHCWTSVARGVDEIAARCAAIADGLDGRAPGDPAVVLVLDDGHEIGDSSADQLLATIARRGRDVDVWLIGATETAAAHRSYGGWISEVRKERSGLLLQPDSDIDGDLLGARLPKSRTSTPGRGFLVARGGMQLVQVAQPTPS
ncbi:MAG: domain containing protein [Frankiales bacterium]|nr:domain containing protein [Frankiales bacterium]